MQVSKQSFCVITGNVRTVYCVASTKQAQHWQTGLHLCDRNATMASRKWKAPIILIVTTGVNGRWLYYGCRKLPMDLYANFTTIVPKVCNSVNHQKPEKYQQWAIAQCQARI